MVSLLVGLGVSFAAAQLGERALWGMYGGNPQHTSQSLETSPTSTPSLAWTFSFGSTFPAPSPAVSYSGIVYTSSPGGVLALNGSSGALLWNRSAALPGTGSTPALSSSCLIVFSDPVGLTAVSCVDGSIRWRWHSGQPCSPPTITGDVVLAGSDNYMLYALNLSTGSLLWEYKTASFVRAAPAVGVDGSTVFVSSLDWTVSGFLC